MKSLRLLLNVFLLLLLLLFVPVSADARGRAFGIVTSGGQVTALVSASGQVAPSSGTTKATLPRTYPGALVTVYNTGTLTLATIFSDNAGTAKSNPFTADANAGWFFYADDADFDVTFSSGGIAVPFTLTAVRVTSSVNSGLFTIRNYGAVCNGVTDDTSAIQATINAAQAFVPDVNLYQPQSPAVYIPGGSTPCKVTASLNVSKPIRIYGDGKESSVLLVSATFNAPVINYTLALAQSVYTYAQFDHFAIKGPNLINGFATQDNMDGILVSNTAPAADVSVEITDMRITGMTGNGIHLNGVSGVINSPKVVNCEIEINSKSGIFGEGAGGGLTNVWFQRNIIRENRVGIKLRDPGGVSMTTGRIEDNLLESNSAGTGGPFNWGGTSQIGSADRPSVGLWLNNTLEYTVFGNYFEGHAYDVYCESATSFNNFIANSFASQTWSFTHTNGPPARRMGALFAGNHNEISANNFIQAPTQQVSAFIASSTNATPIVITTTAAHGQITGDQVHITNHATNTAANAFWTITVLSTTTFSLNGSVGNGVGGATGRVYDDTRWLPTGDSLLTVTGATNANPIVVTATSTTNNFLNNGQFVRIGGVTGNTAANGTFYIQDATTTGAGPYTVTFSLYATTQSAVSDAQTVPLVPVVGNGAYVAGGTGIISGYESVVDFSGINSYYNNHSPNNINGIMLINNFANRHSIVALETDPGESGGSSRKIVTRSFFAVKDIYPSLVFMVEGSITSAANRGAGAGTNVMELQQLLVGATTVIRLTTTAGGEFRLVTRSGIAGTATNVAAIYSTGFQYLQFSGLTFAALAATLPTNGALAYCTDCTIANPCAGGGTGAFAKRLNGVFVCN